MPNETEPGVSHLAFDLDERRLVVRHEGPGEALLADAVDMIADAAIYGIAVGVLAEVVRRALVGSEPEAPLIMGMAAVALVANVTWMALLARHRTGGVHMKASWARSPTSSSARSSGSSC